MQADFNHNNKIRLSYKFFMKGSFFMVLTATVMCAMLIYASTHRLFVPYYATTKQGDLIPMTSLSEPLMTDSRIEQWASIVSRSLYSMDFSTYLQQVNALQPYFTSAGFKSYVQSMKTSGFYKSMMSGHMISQAIVRGRPNLAMKYVQGGKLYWVVQLPLLIGYTTASTVDQRSYMLTLTISRVPVLDSTTGIQVVGATLSPSKK